MNPSYEKRRNGPEQCVSPREAARAVRRDDGALIGAKGVKHGKLAVTTTGKELPV